MGSAKLCPRRRSAAHSAYLLGFHVFNLFIARLAGSAGELPFPGVMRLWIRDIESAFTDLVADILPGIVSEFRSSLDELKRLCSVCGSGAEEDPIPRLTT